ncbi:hypothetical protein CROQUDRAFT_668868 [Cronartium quercuum f. sp. fusiforme G11]|uniref:Transcription factor spt8 beta-propeller domain-containing protein n=1 Tax=Cronartium quercuum f. sp. fusiforme G11 TaxID=708437 RepID=A0A9P6TEV8_9BASI|nr:hypothetical protein CROQUDRAFT_668868 [Cronartium quercuum f. sp. fusiforme G11]
MFSGDEDDQDSNEHQPDHDGEPNEQSPSVSSAGSSSDDQNSSGDENSELDPDEDKNEANESEDDNDNEDQEDDSSEDGLPMTIDNQAPPKPDESVHTQSDSAEASHVRSSPQAVHQSSSASHSLESSLAHPPPTSYNARVACRRQIVTAPRKFLKPPLIDPLVSIPHGCPVHALALPPCGSHLFSGGQDGFIRRIAIYESVTGSTAENLTMRQGGHVSLIEKEGDKTTIFLTGYWENEDDERAVQPVHKRSDPSNSKHATRWGPKSVGNASKVSPVYSLAVHSEELWGLSGTESGKINLFTIRHDEGQIRHVFKATDLPHGPLSVSSEISGHKIGSVVSALELNHEQNIVFSGGWDGNVLGWDLNTGQVVNRFIAHASQISTVALRPDFSSSIYDSKSMDEDFAGRASPKLEEPYHPSEQASEPEAVEQPAQSSPSKPSPEAPEELPASSPEKPMMLDDDDDSTDPDGSLFGGSGSEAGGSTGYAFQASTPAPGPEPIVSHSRTPTAEYDGLSLPRTRTVTETSDFSNGLTLPTAAPKPSTLPTPGPALPLPAPKLPPTKLAQVPSVLDPSLPLLNNDVLLTSGIDGQVYLWDRRIEPVNGRGLVRKLDLPKHTSPWTASATWSLDGRSVFVGRRQNAVDVYDLRFDTTVQRTIRLPPSSGPVTCVKMWPDGNGLVCASFDNVRLWNLKAEADGAKIPFRIIPGNSSGVVSSMSVTPSGRFLVTASGDRGWENTSNECVVIHEVKAMV